MKACKKLMAAAALTMLTTTSAWPVTLSMQLTPAGLSVGQRSFTITTKEVGKFREFDVTMTVEPGGPKLSPFIRGDLTLNMVADSVALVRLEPGREKGRISFWFRVAPAAIENSRFEIGEHAYGVRLKPDGSLIRDEYGLDGSKYWFMLRDFAGAGGP